MLRILTISAQKLSRSSNGSRHAAPQLIKKNKTVR